jgi:hypothetical protein
MAALPRGIPAAAAALLQLCDHSATTPVPAATGPLPGRLPATISSTFGPVLKQVPTREYIRATDDQKAFTIDTAWALADKRGWGKGLVSAVAGATNMTRHTLSRWLYPDTKTKEPYASKPLCLAHCLELKPGRKPTTPLPVQRALHDYIMMEWRNGWVPPVPYVMAKWALLAKAEGVDLNTESGLPSNVAFDNFLKVFRLSARYSRKVSARRLEAEKPHVVTGFFDGTTETIHLDGKEETLKNQGLIETLMVRLFFYFFIFQF